MPKPNFNPFNPNSVVVPTLFAGRTNTVITISKKLGQLKHNMPASFLIHGERGIGKTALAKLLKSISESNLDNFYNLNLLNSYYSVESGQELSSVIQSSINTLTDQMDTTLIQDVGNRVGELFKNGKFTIGAFGATVDFEAGKRDPQRDITIKDQTVSILSNILKATIEHGTKEGILIIIDEIHNLKDLQGAASVFRNISTTLDVDGIGQVAFLLIGYDEDVEKFFSEDSSARRMFDLHPLNVMPDDEAADVLSKGFDIAQYKYDKKILEANVSSAGGYPHSIQVLGHNLIEADNDGDINAPDWVAALSKSAQDLQTKEFSKMFSFGKSMTVKDKMLVEMSLSDHDLTRKELSAKVVSANIYHEIAQLKKLGAIREDEDKKTLSLHSQLFRTAILFDHYIRAS